MSRGSLPGNASAAIEDLRSMFAGDGYELVASVIDPDTVDLQVVAGDGACAECLAPKSVMTEIARARLAGTNVSVRRLLYPDESAAGGPA